MAKINYVELPVGETGPVRAFYEQAFGWTLTEFAPSYAATMAEGTNLGLQADPAEKTAAPLPVIEVDDLEAAHAAVIAAGGRETLAAFAFPGGRRFHFADPAGNELAVMQAG